MNKLDKTQEGQTLLDDGNSYTPLKTPWQGQKVKKKIVEELHQGSFIDETTVKWLSQTPNPPRIPVFYTLTKIHKPTPVVVTKYQNQYESGILSLTKRNFKFFLTGSVLWEKDRVRCPDQIFQYLDNSGTVLSKLHKGDCATCLAADPCNHPCYHNWFLEIGHRMGILKDEDICNDGNGKGKESEIPQESIFQYSPADQIDDACFPLLYGKHKSK